MSDRARFDFSIIVAVYNSEPYLRETVESLIAQDFGFSRVQLILVDDGSRDQSGAICDEYAAKWPQNIEVIHKQNGGVSSARNAGLERAQGTYVNFTDSDDMLSPEALSRVYAFFSEHGDEVDLVSIPMVFFEGKTGDHPLNHKFARGSRVISLEEEWQCIQMACNSSFIKKSVLAELRFDERLSYAEDANLVQRVLLKKQKLGVVAQAAYHYRIRGKGAPSLLQRSLQNPVWYLPTVKYFSQSVFRLAQEELGRIPRFLQFAVMYDMQWRIRQTEIPDGVLSPEDKQEYLEIIRALIRRIESCVILEQKQLTLTHKLHVLRIKYGDTLSAGYTDSDIILQAGGEDVFALSKLWGNFEFLKISEKSLTLEGTIPVFPLLRDPLLLARINGTPAGSSPLKARKPPLSHGEEIVPQCEFRISIPAERFSGKHSLRLFLLAEGTEVPLGNWNYVGFFPLTRKYKRCCYAKNGLLVSRANGGLSVQRAGALQRWKRELAFLRELWKTKDAYTRKAIPVRILAPILRKLRRRPLWLISDRGMKAGDNGEAFFRYMRAEHPEIDARFVIHANCADYSRMRELGPVLKKGSFRYKLLMLSCDYIISSQGEADVFDPFYRDNTPCRDLVVDRRFIFLQHGITKDDLSSWLKRSNKDIYGFITAARPEYLSILQGDYGYSEKEVWLTGFPRFDRLFSSENDPKQITVCPTWRQAVMGPFDPETGIRSVLPSFYTSSFLQFYRSLLNDERLLGEARRLGYRIAFFPHPNLWPYISLFEANPDVRLLGSDCEYRDVFANTSLLLTDYSSTVFDFAYLRKPVLYAQFDREQFFDGSHSYTKGYFDYEQDGFGEVEYDLDSTVSRLIEYMENECRMKPQYRERVDRFFAFDDRNNCKRVYEAILAHETE